MDQFLCGVAICINIPGSFDCQCSGGQTFDMQMSSCVGMCHGRKYIYYTINKLIVYTSNTYDQLSNRTASQYTQTTC